MTRSRRIELLSKLEEAQDLRVISIFLGDRNGVVTKLASDIIPIVFQHLRAIGKKPALGIILYTRGGDTLVPLRLVTLVREFCDTLKVYVPFRAHSAGTMICLGCDHIIMSPLGELSPIDPSVVSPFAPKVEGNQVGISIEEVISYFELARSRGGLTDQETLARVFIQLADSIGPLTLGKINRTYMGIRLLADNLLSQRTMDPLLEPQKAEMLDYLTTKLYFHDRPITRGEVQGIGLDFVEEPDALVDQLMLDIYDTYAEDIGLLEPFSPDVLLGGQSSVQVTVPGAFVESIEMCHAFNFGGTVTRMVQPQTKVPPAVNLPTAVVKWSRNAWERVDVDVDEDDDSASCEPQDSSDG